MERFLVFSPRGQGAPVDCGPGCGWLNVDTVEEVVVAAGFRHAFALTQKKRLQMTNIKSSL